MTAFPVFIEMHNKNVLVVGGGKVAHRKISVLVEFGAKIKVVAPVILKEIKMLEGILCVEEGFDEMMLDGVDMVIAATDNVELNVKIAELCEKKNILVNTASGRANNSFFFPAIAKNEDYIIGVSTNGKSPKASSDMRKKIEQEILGR